MIEKRNRDKGKVMIERSAVEESKEREEVSRCRG